MGVGHRLAIRKNDLIEVIAGKDKGKRGKVLRILPKLDRVLVEKINFVKRHSKPGRLGQRGGILERENPIHVSNVMLFCSECGQGVRARSRRAEDGTKTRVCAKCESLIEKMK